MAEICYILVHDLAGDEKAQEGVCEICNFGGIKGFWYFSIRANLTHIRKEGVMILKRSLIAGIALCCLAQIVSADDIQYSKQYSDCIDKSEGITFNMLDCTHAETARQDARLNKAYKKVMSQLSPARKKQLQAAQRAWIKYRDESCTFYADPDGGTSATMASNDVFLLFTATRAKELEDLIEK